MPCFSKGPEPSASVDAAAGFVGVGVPSDLVRRQCI